MTAWLLRLAGIFKVGWQAIARNKMRSSLTVLGIVIGVACVIAMVAVGNGASRSIQSTISSLGTNVIMVLPGASTQSGARVFTGQSSLTPEDIEGIAEECPAVAYASPSVRTVAQVVAGELNWATTIYGVGVDFPLVRSWNVAEGGFFTASEVRSGAKVAVLGETTAESLFPGDPASAVGQSVRIKNVPFRIVGVLEKKGGSAMGQDQDDQVLVPYTTAMKRILGNPRVGVALLSAVSREAVPTAMEQVRAFLRQRHRLGPGEEDDFMLRSQEEIAASAASTSRTFSVLLGAVAAISLLVGGIGIMNIMLVSVTERTREIGIRLAVGAKGRHVLAQFLLEAVTLSIVGGLAGVGVGLLVSSLVGRFAGWPVAVTPGSVAVAFGFAAAIGIFFGYYPARKAALLDPIEALRYE